MAKIRIQCSECGHEARVPEQYRNKKVRCLRCHAKLRVPENAPVVASSRPKSKLPRRPAGRAATERDPAPRADDRRATQRGSAGPRATDRRPAARDALPATRGGPSSRTRREALGVIRELLHEYDHAVESVPRGIEIDLRGVAFGLARTLAEDMLECRAVSDVKLAGGTGECRIIVTLQGWDFDPEDSFAEDDDDTEVFQRGPGAGAASAGWNPDALLGPAVGVEDQTDPAWHLKNDAPKEPPPESIAQSFFGKDSTGREGIEPVRLYERAHELIEEGEPEEAIPLLERAVKADKNFARAVHALGRAYASTGDYHRARRAFRHLTKLEAENPEAQVLYAAAAVRCERLDEAKASLAAAISLDPEYKQAYRYAALLYEKLGEPEKARKFRARYQALKLRG